MTPTLGALVTCRRHRGNTATATPPYGISDPNLGKCNSATDTDTVVPAPIVADLAVTITDNVTELVPGIGTVYSIVVSTMGPAP